MSDNQCLSDSFCKMTTDITGRLPINVYVIILGIGLFIFMLSMIFCCYLFRLRRQGTQEQYGYNEVIYVKRKPLTVSVFLPFFFFLQQTCAVCLEEFRSRDELGVCPCSHAFHKKCLVKWLEIRSVCPMCNKPICRLQPDLPQGTEGPQNPLEV
uniref:Si:dkey-51a16.9 n=1 Tax=Cyprinus carpio TaxID=7962 RepID=A0A8C2JS80_CYPCA